MVEIGATTFLSNLSALKHSCSGTSCEFCAWRKENPICLGWERLYRLVQRRSIVSRVEAGGDGCEFETMGDEFESIFSQGENAIAIAVDRSTATAIAADRYGSPKGTKQVETAIVIVAFQRKRNPRHCGA